MEVKAIADYIGAIPSETLSSEYMIGCENVEKLPVINIVIDGNVYPLHGEDYVLSRRVADKKRNLCETAFVGRDQGVFLFYYLTIKLLRAKIL